MSTGIGPERADAGTAAQPSMPPLPERTPVPPPPRAEAPAPQTAAAGTPVIPAARYSAVEASDEFRGLRKALRSFVFPATVAFLAWYLLYVLLSAYARDFMAAKVIGNINVAFIFGILQFVSTFGIAIAYSKYAERKLDPIANRIRAELEGGAE
jgi:uncharacterized membrane protein (DUF485 family)